MKILLLGSTGLLGHNVLRQLLFDGHEVVVLVRNPHKLQIHDDRIQIIKGGLDGSSLEIAANGCEAIVNCAGVTDMGLLRLEDYQEVNTRLNESLVEVMKYHGIRRLVHVSTANTIGYGTKDRLAVETDSIQAPFDRSYYAVSKKDGENVLIQKAHQNPDWHIVIVNPGFMIGPFDTKPSSGTLLLAGYRKPIMAAPKGGKSFVAAKDAAKAVCNALTMGHNGEKYLLTGENLTLKEFYHLQAEIMGYRQVVVSLPNGLVGIAGRLGDLLRLCHIPTQLSTRNVRQLMVTEHYSNLKAVSELQMPQTPIREAVSDFFSWWRNNK